jgi:hypothetical protein
VSDTENQGITIAGETFVPDTATAYVEFFLSHAFPVYLDVPNPGEEPARTAIHPATIANSYRSLRGKVLNLGHLMRAYDPENNTRDRIFGTVMAVEFPETPSDGWKVQGDPELAPGIRAVAAMHKNAEGVKQALESWQNGRTPFSDTQWTVSMENEAYLEEGGFLLKAESGKAKSGKFEGELKQFEPQWVATPEDFRGLGWLYVPWADAPKDLQKTLKDGGEIALAVDNYEGHELLFLNGGLNGKIFYYGVALTPAGKESRARVGRMVASAESNLDLAATVAVATACEAIGEFCEKIYDAKGE